MHGDQPRANQVDDVMQRVRVRHAINRSIDGEDEEEDVGDVSSPRREAGDHFAAGEGFDEY